MVTQIQLGTFFSENGRTVVAGGNSGLDIKGLIDSLATAKRQPAVKLETKIDTNTKTIAAFDSLKTILSKFKDAANFLRNPPGVQNESSNVFDFRTSTVTSNTGVAGSTYVATTVQPGAAIQSYSISEITQLATNHRQRSGSFAIANADTAVVSATPAAGQFGVGTITIAGQNITLTAGDTLNQVASKFNSVSDATGLTATVVKAADNDFRLSISSTATGAAAAFNLNAGGGTVTDPSGALNTVTFSTVQTAQNSKFILDGVGPLGVTVERSTNSISDAISGVTFDLKAQTPPGTTLTLDIAADKELAKTAISNFADAYNQFRLFYSQQTATKDDGTPADSALLGTNQTFRSYLDSASQEISKSVSGLTGITSLADIGITFGDFAGDDKTPFTRNILSVDDNKLTSKLATNFDDVQKVFGFNLTSDNPSLQAFNRSNKLSIQNFVLTIDRGTNTYTANYTKSGVPTSATFTGTPLGSGGVSLVGDAGTDVEGLNLIFAKTGNATINVSVTQGIGDRIFNNLDSALTDNTGSLAVEVDAIKTQNTNYQKEVTRIDDQITQYRDQLLTKYSGLESALSKVNNLLSSLDAQAKARASG